MKCVPASWNDRFKKPQDSAPYAPFSTKPSAFWPHPQLQPQRRPSHNLRRQPSPAHLLPPETLIVSVGTSSCYLLYVYAKPTSHTPLPIFWPQSPLGDELTYLQYTTKEISVLFCFCLLFCLVSGNDGAEGVDCDARSEGSRGVHQRCLSKDSKGK